MWAWNQQFRPCVRHGPSRPARRIVGNHNHHKQVQRAPYQVKNPIRHGEGLVAIAFRGAQGKTGNAIQE